MGVTVLLVDDHPVVRQGIHGMLEHSLGYKVIGQAEDMAGALRLAREAPTVIVLDLYLGDQRRPASVRSLLRVSPSSRVLVLTMSAAARDVRAAFQEGASGYMLKASRPAEILHAIKTVAQGVTHLDPRLCSVILPGKDSDATAVLTDRERETLALAAAGKTNKEIAKELGLSIDTVKSHLSKAFLRLGAADRASAVAIAMDRRLL